MINIDEMSINKNAITIVKLLNKQGYEAYLVGGCVRDMLLGVEPNDWDICTDATPIEVINCLQSNKVMHYESGIDFGTITAILNGEEFEVTTYRKETGYADNRHPDKIQFTKNLQEDLCRRDFTINAIAFNIVNNEIVDPFGGHIDLENRILRTVGNPEDRFNEDALRILRAIRFAIRFNMNIENSTEYAMIKLLDNLDSISKERVTQELEKMLTSGNSVTKHFLEYSCIIAKIIPEIGECIGFEQNNKYHKHNVYEHMLAVVDLCKSNDFIIKLSALLHDIGKPKAYTTDTDGNGHFYGHPDISYEICQEIVDKRLVLTKEQREELLTLVKYHDFNVRRTTKSLKRAMRTLGEELIDKWFILKQADVDDHINLDIIGRDEYGWRHTSELKQIKDEIIASEQCFSLSKLAVNGRDIMGELGIKPGKQVGQILTTLLEEVIDEKIVNDYDILIKRAGEIIVE